MRASIVRAIVVLVLIVAAIWTANLALYNWWAAGGPPTANPQQYQARGNVFGFGTVLLISAAVAIVVVNLKRSRRGSDLKTR